MTRRSVLFVLVLFVVVPACVFSQASGTGSGASGAAASGAAVLRDYVGLISQSYHPGITAYFEKLKIELSKKGRSAAIRAIDIYLRGATGSGFLYGDASGNLYIITNNHVIGQAYSLSITFERQDGSKRTFDNLTIIAADEESDLALLAFAPGDRPAARGLSFVTRPVEEGADVYSAGFPGLGTTPLWQLGRGIVSNASARFPKSLIDETMMGPFIQHTAQIDPGNSGGPLLVVQQNAQAGYAVAGINTLSGLRRQAANYAVPAGTAAAFISAALNQKPETFRAALDARLDRFIEGLGGNKAAYPHIAEFLSFLCVGENAEYAMQELFAKGNASVQQSFAEKCEESVVGAMGYAVAWTIETSIRGQGAIKASVKSVTGSGSEYTVVFTINNKDVQSTWVREYGNWRIRTFGTVAAGKNAPPAKKETPSRKKTELKIQKTDEKLRIDSPFHIEAGYANLFDKAPTALYACAEIMRYGGARVYYVDADFWTAGVFFGYRFDIPMEKIAYMPYFRMGFDYHNDKAYKDFGSNDPPIDYNLQAGLKVTSSYVPGLFVGAGFQYNFTFTFDDKYDKKKLMRMALVLTAGYAF